MLTLFKGVQPKDANDNEGSDLELPAAYKQICCAILYIYFHTQTYASLCSYYTQWDMLLGQRHTFSV